MVGGYYEHRSREGELYLCAAKEVFSRQNVEYSISDCMGARIAVDTVNHAASRCGHVTECIVDSDRGSQFRSRKYLRALEFHGLVGSMGRVGDAGDNAAMESSFAMWQIKVLNRRARPLESSCGQRLCSGLRRNISVNKAEHRRAA